MPKGPFNQFQRVIAPVLNGQYLALAMGGGDGIASGGIEYYLPIFFEQTATVFDYLGTEAGPYGKYAGMVSVSNSSGQAPRALPLVARVPATTATNRHRSREGLAVAGPRLRGTTCPGWDC